MNPKLPLPIGRVVTAVVIFAAIASAQETRRPTTQTNTVTPTSCPGTGVASTSAPNFYDGSGEATNSSVVGVPGLNASAPNKYRQAILSGWQAASGAYGSLSVKIRSACSTDGPGLATCKIDYSTNGGSTWNVLRSGWWGAITDSVSLSSNQNLSQLQIRYCVQGHYYIDPFTGDPAAELATLTGYDVRTEGTLTPAAPSNLAGNPAANGLSVSVTWTDNSTNESGFKLDRCTGSGCSNFALQASVAVNATSFPDTTAACTTYNYRAYAFNAQGNSAFSNTVQVSTPCVPTVPAGLRVSSATTTSISLSWTDSSGETSYSLERCSGGNCSDFAPVNTPAANATSYTDPSLPSNNVYSYRLRASNAVGSSGFSNTVNGLTEQTLSLSTPYVTKYTYDTLGNLTKVEQQGAATTCDPTTSCRVRTFEYDSLSRLTKAINPESGQIAYSYDDDGNLTAKISPKPNDQTGSNTVTTNFGYDVLHRLTGKTYTNITETAVAYTFDQGANGIGRRTGMTDASGSTNWAYDELGRVLSEARTIGTASKTISYSYNKDGSMASITYPSGHVITYTTSGAGRTLSAVDLANAVNYATEATYTPAGAPVGMKNGATGSSSGIVTVNTYNSRQQPVSLTATNSAGAAVLSLTYNFAANLANNGNVANIVNNRDHSRDQSFFYDDLNRIKGASSPNWGLSFRYDPWGNLLGQNQTGGTVPTLSVAATKANRIQDYCYDPAGNLVRNNVCPLDPAAVDYTYDAENRLKTAGGVTYTYDGDGKRVKKSSGTVYWTGMGSNPLVETDSAGNNSTEYIFLNYKRVARRDSNGAVHYYFSDHLGSTSVVTNSIGAIPAEEESEYYPFGGERTITAGPNRYKFTGKERDAESGLDYFGARHYNAASARFLSTDPVVITPERFFDPQQLNAYAYVRNNPLKLVDPTGMRLRLAGNASVGLAYLCILAGDACDRIILDDDGNLSFNTAGLDMSANEGAAIINDLVQSGKMYEFSIGTDVEVGEGTLLIDSMANLDRNPQTYGTVKEIATPRAGVDGQVAVNNLSKRHSDTKLRPAGTDTVVFHELAEAYAKVDHGKVYEPAHQEAIQRETKLREQRPYLKLENPGSGPGDSRSVYQEEKIIKR